MYAYIETCTHIYIYIYRSLPNLSICLSLSLCVSSTYLTMYPCIYLPFHISFYLSIYLSTCLCLLCTKHTHTDTCTYVYIYAYTDRYIDRDMYPGSNFCDPTVCQHPQAPFQSSYPIFDPTEIVEAVK